MTMTHFLNLVSALLCLSMLIHNSVLAEDLPRIHESNTIEIHGTLYGQRFWARLLPPDQRFAGHRMLQLLYSPSEAEQPTDTVLVDHPFLLLDQHARLIAWNERELGLSQVEYRPQANTPYYHILHERSEMRDGDLFPIQMSFEPESPTPVWDLRLAPLKLAFVWTAANQTAYDIPMLHFFASQDEIPAARLRYQQTRVLLPEGQEARIEADAAGRLLRLTNSDDEVLFEIWGWIAPEQEED